MDILFDSPYSLSLTPVTGELLSTLISIPGRSTIAFKKNNLATSRPGYAFLGRSSIALSSSSILFHMKDRGVPSMANPLSGIMIHWILISSASPSTRAASPAVLLNQIGPISHNLNMISSNFFFLKAMDMGAGNMRESVLHSCVKYCKMRNEHSSNLS
jgi:hypothetical protein